MKARDMNVSRTLEVSERGLVTGSVLICESFA